MMHILHRPKGRPIAFIAGLLFLGFAASFLFADNSAVEKRMRRDLAFLASKECEGRGVDTEGLEKAAAYVAKQFREAGLKPGGKNGTYFQPFTVSRPSKLIPGSRLVLHGPQGQTIELKDGEHFSVMGYSGGGKVKAPVVFAGYGVTADGIKYDDYKNVDVKGKIVILLRKLPRWDNEHVPFAGKRKRQHAALVNKLANAELHKAAAMILVNDRTTEDDDFIPFRDISRGASSGSIPALQVKRAVVDKILLSSLGRGLPEIERAISSDLKPRSAVLTGWRATVDAKIERKEATVKNVIGVLKGSGPLAKEYVVIGAHYDHLGYGERGTLAKNAADRKKIHFGADDNASGTTTVLELARRFGKMKNRQGRTLIFMTFSAEEKGLLGSRHYCNKEPLFSLKKTAAMVNLDMVGRMDKNKLIAQGIGTAKSFEPLLGKLNKKYKFRIRKVKGGTGPSDHDSFYRKKIPVFFFWTGVHSDYHRPTDTYDRINYKDMVRIADLATDVIDHLAERTKRPQYVQVKSDTGPRPTGNMPRMGIRPAYDSDKKGLLIDGVSPKGPAEKAGMKAGDLIVAINKQPVTNIRTYMLIMVRQKRGRSVPVTVQRGKKKVELKVVPE